nr:hypothetical protein [Tanacetum cinerariifolium]
MSTHEQTPRSQPASTVRITLGKEQILQDLGRPASDAALRERMDLRKRLGSRSIHNTSRSPEPRRGRSKSPRKRVPERKMVFKRLEKDVCHRLGDKGKRLSQGFWGEAMAVVRLPDPKLKTLGERGIECIFVGYAEHSKAFRFYVIEPNESVSINLIIESNDALFDENSFSSVSGPSLRIPNGTEDIGGSVVPEEVTEEDGPKTFDEAIKSQDVAFWKEAINDEIDSIMGNNTWVLVDLPPGIDYFDTYAPVARISTIRLLIAMASIHNLIIHQMDVKTAFLNGDLMKRDMGKVDVILGIRIKHESNGITISQSHYIEKVLKKFNYFDCTLVSTPMDTSEKLMPNNGQVVSQLEYFRVIGCLIYAMTCTRPDIAFVVGKLSSVATLANAYSQIYNGKSRHPGVKHSMIRELITNGVIYIEFVRSQQNLADHLTKGPARDLVIKSAEGMGLKSN